MDPGEGVISWGPWHELLLGLSKEISYKMI